MDDRNAPPPKRKGLLSGQFNTGDNRDEQQAQEPGPGRPAAPSTGGLLSRFGGQPSTPPPPQPPTPAGQPGQGRAEGRGGLLSGGRGGAGTPADRKKGKSGKGGRSAGSTGNLAGGATRAPGHRDWRATDFAPEEIDDWDQNGEAPFHVPPDPDGPHAERGGRGASRSTRDQRDAWGERDERDNQDGWDAWEAGDQDNGRDNGDWGGEWDSGSEVDWDNASWDDERAWRGGGRRAQGRNAPRGYDRDAERDYDRDDDRSYDDEASGYESAYQPASRSQRGDQRTRRDQRGDDWDSDGGWDGGVQDDDAHWNLVGDLRGSLDADAITSTLAQLGAVSPSVSRLARIRLLVRRRPAAAAMMAFLLLGFMLTCCAPLAPLLRLGYDVSDLARRANDLRALTAGGGASLINAANITRAQADIAGIESDLYEINGAVAVAGAPAAAVSHSARDIQLLVRIGYDLTGAANESLQIAQRLATPLEGGALSSSGSAPGITPADIQEARVLLSDAYVRALDAIQTYNQIDPAALPSQLKPGTKYGDYLAQLPLIVKVFAEMKDLIDAAPALLGVGQPAYYLALSLDSSELRPGGGFQGNYGILEIDGGKQSKTNQFSLINTYFLDQVYAAKAASSPPPSSCQFDVTEPTNLYWWWPPRCIQQYGWGLRDENLSADFPTSARLAMQIAEAGGATPKGAPIQGVVAFTPGLIAKILAVTGNLDMPDYHVTITPANLVTEIHHYQLEVQSTGDRKQFTHDLSKALLARIKGMHGGALKVLFKVAEEAILSKDLQVYLADPRAELLLQQLSIASSIATGNGDGYFVVDTNDGGNKGNLYVSETQTDVVTLLPNGGAFHRLAIAVTYNKTGTVYNPGSNFYDYSDLQRTYLPGDATIVGWSGFDPSNFFQPAGCDGNYSSVITDCSPDHGIFSTTTNSDVPGRTMVMGALMVMCGPIPQTDYADYTNFTESDACQNNPQPHTQTIYLSWYTPNAYTVDASGHGTYTELVEKQAGDLPHLTVFVTRGALRGAQVITRASDFAALTAGAQKVFDGDLSQNTMVSYSF